MNKVDRPGSLLDHFMGVMKRFFGETTKENNLSVVATACEVATEYVDTPRPAPSTPSPPSPNPPALPQPPPPAAAPTPADCTGPHAGLCAVVWDGYQRLIARRLYSPHTEKVSETTHTVRNHVFDGWNVVESTCLLAAHCLGPNTTKSALKVLVDHRLMLCACLCIACKNELDNDAFPVLRNTLYRHTPLAVVYHLLFERLVNPWDDNELDARWLQGRLEAAEGVVIARIGDRLFWLLNDTPTLRVELDVLAAMQREESTNRGSTELAIEMTTSVMRSVASFYVHLAFSGYDRVLCERLMTRPDDVLVRALAIIAVLSIKQCCSSQDEYHTWVPPSLCDWLGLCDLRDAQALALRIVPVVLHARSHMRDGARLTIATHGECNDLVSAETIAAVLEDLQYSRV